MTCRAAACRPSSERQREITRSSSCSTAAAAAAAAAHVPPDDVDDDDDDFAAIVATPPPPSSSPSSSASAGGGSSLLLAPTSVGLLPSAATAVVAVAAAAAAGAAEEAEAATGGCAGGWVGCWRGRTQKRQWLPSTIEAGTAADGSMYTKSGWRTPCVIASRECTCSRPSRAVCSSSSSPCGADRCTQISARGWAHASGTGCSSYGSRSSIRRYMPCSSRSSTHPTPSSLAAPSPLAPGAGGVSATTQSREMAAPTETLLMSSRLRMSSRWSVPSRLPSTAPHPPRGAPRHSAQLLMPVARPRDAAWLAISSAGSASSASSMPAAAQSSPSGNGASHRSRSPPGSSSVSPAGAPIGGGGRRIRCSSGSTKAAPSCEATSSPTSSCRCMAATPLVGPLNQRSWRTSGGLPWSAAASSSSTLDDVASATYRSPAATCRMELGDVSASGASRKRWKSRRGGGGGIEAVN